MGFQRDVATTIGSRLATLAFGLVRSVVIARYLLPEGRGAFAILMLIPEFVVVITPLGLPFALTYHLRLREHRRETVLQSGLGLALILGGLGLMTTLACEIALHDSFLAGLSAVSLVAAALMVPTRVLQACWQGVFRGTERIFHANLLNAGRPLLVLIGAVVALVGLSTRVAGLAVSFLIAETAVVVVGAIIIFEGVSLRPRLDRPAVSSLLSYGVRVWGVPILLFVNYRLGMAIVRAYVDYAEVGYFVTAVALAEMLWMVPSSLGFVLFPSVVGASDDRRNLLTAKVSRITVFLMSLACLAIALLAFPMIRILYGEAFVPAALPLIAILPGILAMSVQQVLGPDIAARGRPGAMTIAAGIGVAVNLALNLWWVPPYGALGAALASTVSYLIVAGLVFGFFLRLSGVRFLDAVLLKASDVKEVLDKIRRLRGPRA
jgi:O-antigen/teichoic acid export membrane protein